jgi:hypothetical protein
MGGIARVRDGRGEGGRMVRVKGGKMGRVSEGAYTLS